MQLLPQILWMEPLSTHGNWEGHAERGLCTLSHLSVVQTSLHREKWSTGHKGWVEVEGCTDELTDGWMCGCVRRHCPLVPLLLCTYPPSSVLLVFPTSTSLSTLSYWRDLPQPFFLVPPHHSTFLPCFIFFLITTRLILHIVCLFPGQQGLCFVQCYVPVPTTVLGTYYMHNKQI